MDLELKDQVGLVVGVAQGIGRAIGDAFILEFFLRYEIAPSYSIPGSRGMG